MGDKMPRDVECPHCGAKVDHGCHNPSYYAVATHKARWKAIGIPKPTGEQLSASYLHDRRLDFEIRTKVMARLRSEIGMP